VEITQTTVIINKNGGEDNRLKAFATIEIDNCFKIRDLKVIKGNNRLFVSMPSKQIRPGDYREIVSPLNQETRNLVEKAVLEEYGKEISKIKSLVEDLDL